MPQNDLNLAKLEELVEDNRIALEHAEDLLASMQTLPKGETTAQTSVTSESFPAVPPPKPPETTTGNSNDPATSPWLDLAQLARVELTSGGSAAYPIESVFSQLGPGWRSLTPGRQTIRLVFTQPQSIHRIYLEFLETERERTQEFVLSWRQNGAQNHREIVRQQYVFSPGGSTREVEEYRVDLPDLIEVDLSITPDINGGNASASLAKWGMT